MALTAEYVRSRLAYDPETGVLTWKPKLESTPIDKMWNTRFAGKRADHHNSSGHVQFGLDGRNYLGHRIAWLIVYGEWPAGILDHEDKVRDNNRLSNLRDATRSQNAANSKLRVDNTSGFRGVHWRPRHKKWTATIRVSGRHITLGNFAEKTEAAKAYDAAAIANYGPFAGLNFAGECNL